MQHMGVMQIYWHLVGSYRPTFNTLTLSYVHHVCVTYHRCVKCATDWVTSLEGKGGANLLEALKLALEIPDLDTICVILSTM